MAAPRQLGRVWTRQPSSIAGIDWDAGVTRKLAFAWVPGAPTRDLVRGLSGTVTGAIAHHAYRNGVGVSFGTANYSGVDFGVAQPLSSKLDVTIVAVAAPTSVATQGPIFGQRNPATGASLALMANATPTGTIAGAIGFNKNNTGANSRGASVTGQCDGEWHTFAFASDKVNGSAYHYARDGVYQAVTGNDAAGTWVDSGTEVTVGFRAGITATGNFPIALVLAWDRQLSIAELQSITLNPWQIFKRRLWVPVAAAGGGNSIAVPAGALSLTGFAPTVSQTANQTIPVPLGALSLTGFAPTVSSSAGNTIDVPVGALSLAGLAPVVSATANNQITVPAGALSLTGYSPSVSSSADKTIDVPLGALSLAGLAPTISVSGNNLISVPSGGLSLTGFAPTVTYGAAPVVTLRAGSWIRYIQIV